MARHFPAIVCAILLLFGDSAEAAVVRDLYSARVPVTGQSDRALADGARAALEEVLVKVSGSNRVLKNAAIAEALAEARSQVLTYAFERADSNGEELLARFEFDRSYVAGLLMRAGEPLWTANRPVVLVWLVTDGPEGRQFVNRDTDRTALTQLYEVFSRRGVPIQLPLFDLADTAALSPEEAWGLDSLSLRSASSRYDTQHILAGRVTQLSNGMLVGDWSYLSPRNRLDRSVEAAEMGEYLDQGVAVVADEMAARYAVAPTEAGQVPVAVTVSGVTDYAGYAAIISWLESLEVVDRTTVEQIRGDTLMLRLRARTAPSQLAVLFELNEQFEPVRVPGGPGRLNYQWRP